MTRTSVGNRAHVHFYLDEPILEGMKRVAVLRNTTYSELMRVACREYLVREAAKAAAESKTLSEIGK
jgi:hypothetical protein